MCRPPLSSGESGRNCAPFPRAAPVLIARLLAPWVSRRQPGPLPVPAPPIGCRWSSPAIAWYARTAIMAVTAGDRSANNDSWNKNRKPFSKKKYCQSTIEQIDKILRPSVGAGSPQYCSTKKRRSRYDILFCMEKDRHVSFKEPPYAL